MRPRFCSRPNDNQKHLGAGVFKWSPHKTQATITFMTLSEVLGHPQLHSLQNIAIRIATHQIEGASHIQQYASIFTLLSGVERLLEINYHTNTAEESKNELKIKLTQLCSIVSVKAPSWLPQHSSRTDPTGMLMTAREVSGISQTAIENSLPMFKSWLENLKKLDQNIKPSALFLGKVWPRLYFSLSKIADPRYHEETLKNETPAYLMHLYVICLLNAFLVEELDHHYNENTENKKINLMDRTNPIHDAIPFFDKLSNLRFEIAEPKTGPKKSKAPKSTKSHEFTLTEFDGYFPFTMLIMRCPLIIPFLVYHPENYTERATQGHQRIKYPEFFNELFLTISPNAMPGNTIEDFRKGLNVLNHTITGQA